jgi:hypothetical protein
MPGHVDLAQGELVVVLVVQDVHQVGVEGMHVVHLGKVGQHLGHAIVVVLLRELDLAQVELSDTRDLVLLVDYGRCLALCLGQDDIDEVLYVEKKKKRKP